jgi:uncharacterized protein (TIGR03437 family)
MGQERTPAVISYFKGRPGQWKAGLPTYSRIVYKDLWPGIDLLYSGETDRLKYQFVIQPGARPEQIRLAYRGAESVKVNEAGQLEVSTPAGGFHDEKPYAWQEAGGRRREVAAGYALRGAGEYGFQVGDYDASLPLVLDPAVLVYAGYIGGSGLDQGFGIAVDGAGNAYVNGYTQSSQANFPVTVGPDLTYNGSRDAFVAKVKADGTGLVYAGYIGGSDDDRGFGIAVDGAGNAYVTGFTYSSDFPVTVGPDLTFNGGADAFVAKVKADGTSLVYAGYIGGSGDDIGFGIAVDGAGNAYVTGFTTNSFPVTVGPDLTYNGGQDAFVAKVKADGTGLVYAGYIGGSGFDLGFGIAVDGAGNAYVTGYTQSSQATFPVTVGPGLTYKGNTDAFVAKVEADGTGLVYAGYIGGSGDDEGRGIAVDGAGNAYVTGYTQSSQATFPVTVGPDLTFNGVADAFVAKVKADGTGLVYAGYIGGSDFDLGFGIAVDGAGSAYVTGYTYSSDFPVTVGPGLTYKGNIDAFVAKIGAGGCPPHTVHGHISTAPPAHSGAVSHQHHGQHGHTVPLDCPPHAPGHSPGLLPDPGEELAATMPAAVFQAGGPARRGDLLQLFGPAEGFFLGEEDGRPAGEFTAPASGLLRFYTTSLPEVRVGGAPARVLFSGLAPGRTGVWEIDVIVPPQAPAGSPPITVSYEGAALAASGVLIE